MNNSIFRSGASPNAGDVRPRSAGSAAGRLLIALLLSVALVGVPSLASAGDVASKTSREGGLGAAAALSTLVYGPVKLVYAVSGLVFGSCAWAVTAGDTEVAKQVFTRSVRGTYVITPEHLTGEQELVFIGRDGGLEETTTATVAAASPPETTSDDYDEAYEEMGW